MKNKEMYLASQIVALFFHKDDLLNWLKIDAVQKLES